MATIWRSHQVCETCGWAGVTRAHRAILVSGLLYVITAIAVLVLEALGGTTSVPIPELPAIDYYLSEPAGRRRAPSVESLRAVIIEAFRR